MGHGYLVVIDIWNDFQNSAPGVGTEKGWAQRQIWEGKVYSIDWLERDGCGTLT